MSTEYSRTYDWTDDRDAAVKISSTRMDVEADAVVDKLNQKVLVKATAPSSPIDGQTWVDIGQNPPVVKIYDTTNSRWRQTGGFVDRGDPAAVDYSLGDLTESGAFVELDLSSIVTVGAKAVLLLVGYTASAVDKQAIFSKMGNSNAVATSRVRCQVANQRIDSTITVPMDSGGSIRYWLDSTETTAIELTVLGWFF